MTRSGHEIGAGLDPARAARPVAQGERIHVVGAAGAGASAAALLAHGVGAAVTACDSGGPTPYVRALAHERIPIEWSHDPAHIGAGDRASVDRVAVTKALTSVDPDHPELMAARRLGVPLESWQQVVADAAATTGQRLVAVTGTHGKSTSSGWLVHLLAHAGRDPSAFVGALLPAALTSGVASTARLGDGDEFIVEADEYAGNFDPYHPRIAVLLNAEWDHPDVFADAAAVHDAFAAWIEAAANAATAEDGSGLVVVANVGDAGVRAVLERVRGEHVRVVGAALADEAAAVPDGTEVIGTLADGILRLDGVGDAPVWVRMPLDGRHNAANAVCVAAAAFELGVPGDQIGAGLASFGGVGRRMELMGEPRGVTVLDDYGHHPTAIAATLDAVQGRYPGRPVWAVYEPLTYHRTAAMLDEFAVVLARADHAVIADIWAGRDPDTTITSADALARAVSAKAVEAATAPGSVERTADHLAERVRPGDVVLVMGGGRSYVIAERLIALLSDASAAGR